MKRFVEILDSSEEDNAGELPNDHVEENNMTMEDAKNNENGNENNENQNVLVPQNIMRGNGINHQLVAMPNMNGSALSLGAQNYQGTVDSTKSKPSKPSKRARTFRCKSCSKSYTLRGSLLRHFKDKHKDQMVCVQNC